MWDLHENYSDHESAVSEPNAGTVRMHDQVQPKVMINLSLHHRTTKVAVLCAELKVDVYFMLHPLISTWLPQ